MCGIIGYIGHRDSAKIGLIGLKRLEYRGYDSAGAAVINNGVISVKKDVGRIDDIENDIKFSELPGHIGIFHTRWSTHGEPSKLNAHPHTDCNGDIAIVHNGIIENYSSLKSLLIQEGHKIESDTDSEIIAHMIEKFYEGDLEDAVRKTLTSIKGAYGLVAIHKNEEKIIAARKGSPLVLGVGDGEMFVASDAAAIVEYTRDVIYMEDKEIAVLTKDGCYTKTLDNKEVKKNIDKITWDLEQIEKSGFKHFMLKEIFEQPKSIENTLRGRLKDKIKLSTEVDINNIDRIIITACGTSWHAALIGKYLLESFVNIPVEVDYASELRYRNSLINDKTLLIVISQSGETADTLAALKEAKRKGARTMGIVNVVGSTITRETDTGMFLHAGPEIGVASTKAFTSQVVALVLFALYLRQQLGLEMPEELIKELKILPEKIQKTLNKKERVLEIAKEFKDAKNFLYLGRGLNFPAALEGALKLKEISYIHAEGYPAAEMKHGPIALIDDNMPVVFIANKTAGYEKILNNMEEVKARKGKIICIATEGDEEIKRLSDHVIYVPETVEELTPIINSVPLQLLAYYIADLKNLDCDHPRNLSKSVTVE
ncbi:MAG: glutamine--fructose-6-phosphate transaminase (isomerizing) [Candidatus Aenigmatarchaeota archaeon]